MLESFPVAILAGTVLGFLSGLGVGGGSLLMLWLTLVLHVQPSDARAINLLFFLPSAIIACLFRWRQGNLPIKKIIPSILAGCISAALFSGLRNIIDTGILKKLFGGLLLVTGIRELFYRPKERKQTLDNDSIDS